MNTTIETKRLIAKFMNYANNRPLTDELLKSLYNDWNSLMEVDEKIKKLGYWIRTQSTNNGSHLSIFIGKTGNNEPIIQYGRAKAKEVYYNAFVEFIKWYNQNK